MARTTPMKTAQPMTTPWIRQACTIVSFCESFRWK